MIPSQRGEPNPDELILIWLPMGQDSAHPWRTSICTSSPDSSCSSRLNAWQLMRAAVLGGEKTTGPLHYFLQLPLTSPYVPVMKGWPFDSKVKRVKRVLPGDLINITYSNDLISMTVASSHHGLIIVLTLATSILHP